MCCTVVCDGLNPNQTPDGHHDVSLLLCPEYLRIRYDHTFEDAPPGRLCPACTTRRDFIEGERRATARHEAHVARERRTDERERRLQAHDRMDRPAPPAIRRDSHNNERQPLAHSRVDHPVNPHNYWDSSPEALGLVDRPVRPAINWESDQDDLQVQAHGRAHRPPRPATRWVGEPSERQTQAPQPDERTMGIREQAFTGEAVFPNSVAGPADRPYHTAQRIGPLQRQTQTHRIVAPRERSHRQHAAFYSNRGPIVPQPTGQRQSAVWDGPWVAVAPPMVDPAVWDGPWVAVAPPVVDHRQYDAQYGYTNPLISDPGQWRPNPVPASSAQTAFLTPTEFSRISASNSPFSRPPPPPTPGLEQNHFHGSTYDFPSALTPGNQNARTTPADRNSVNDNSQHTRHQNVDDVAYTTPTQPRAQHALPLISNRPEDIVLEASSQNLAPTQGQPATENKSVAAVIAPIDRLSADEAVAASALVDLFTTPIHGGTSREEDHEKSEQDELGPDDD